MEWSAAWGDADDTDAVAGRLRLRACLVHGHDGGGVVSSRDQAARLPSSGRYQKETLPLFAAWGQHWLPCILTICSAVVESPSASSVEECHSQQEEDRRTNGDMETVGEGEARGVGVIGSCQVPVLSPQLWR